MLRARLVLPVVAFCTIAVAQEPPPKLRLANDPRPLREKVRVTVDPTQTTFAGAVDIELAIAHATSTVWLNGTNLTIDKAAFVSDGKSEEAKIVPGGVDFIGFQAGRELAPGKSTLHVEYHGKITRNDDHGLFAQQEAKRWYAITQFESIFARRAIPCFDEPSFKVPWQLTLEVPRALKAVSNTAVVKETQEHPGLKTLVFAETPPLPSYLLAFAVGPYELVDGGKAGKKPTPVRVVAPLGRAKDAAYAAGISGKLVALLEEYFALPFPYDKLDAVAIPITTTFGAMENAGMVTFAENLLVAKPTNRSLDFEREYAIVAAHEFAHQWFGDSVTMGWWDDIWLNESFASFMEAKIIDDWKPEWTHRASYVEARATALRSDALMTARKIRQPIVTNDDIYNAFDGITYQKGESVLRMFERYVGADKFADGIRRYLGKHKDGNATADDFIAAQSAAYGKDLGPAYKTFLDQAGAPLVDVKLECQKDKPPVLSLKQQRFVPVGAKGAGAHKWHIPIGIRYAVGDDTRSVTTLMTDASAEVLLGQPGECPAFVLVNDGEVGYYRVAYPADLLSKILDEEGRKRLSLPEIVGVLDDLNALTLAGRVPEGDALGFTPSLAKDSRRLVAEETIEMAKGLHQHLVSDAVRPNYQHYIGKLFGERAHALGWTATLGEDEDTRLLRPQIVALVADEGEDAELQKAAKALVLKWLTNRKAVSPDVIESALHVAARAGDRALFDKLHAAAKRASDRRDRVMLLRALGAFRDPAIAKAALAIALTNEFDARESAAIMWRLSGEAPTRPLAWEFLKANFDTLVKRLTDEVMAQAPFLAARFCDEAHEREMHEFFKDRSPKLPGGPRYLAQAEEQSQICRAYVAAQQPSVTAFLQKW